MAGPLVAAQAAQPIVQGAIKVLSTDIVQAEGKIYRRVKKRIPVTDEEGRIRLTKKGRVRYTTIIDFVPIDVSAHVNPIGLGVLAAGAALGAALLFGRVKVGVLGVGELELYKGPLADDFDAWLGKHREIRSGRRPAANGPTTNADIQDGRGAPRGRA